MKKLWFKRKAYGWGWVPASGEGWAVLLLYFLANISVFLRVDRQSHSVSDTLIAFAPQFLLFALLLYVLCTATGEKPQWQWGKGSKNLTSVLKKGGIAVIPTDTTYGIVASALNERAVAEVYRLRKRDLNKPFIIFIADTRELKRFGVVPTSAQKKTLERVWPGPVSVILPAASDTCAYLHRGKKTLAFRVPAKPELCELLRRTGPLVAPSANPQGHMTARSVAEARAYFGEHVDWYEDGGVITASPSRVIDITDGTEKILRG